MAISKEVSVRLDELIVELGRKPSDITRVLASEFGDEAPLYGTVYKRCKDFEGTVSAELPKAESYDFISKQHHHRRPVYTDLARTSGNIFVLSSPELLDIPAALEAGIAPSRLYITSKELTSKHKEGHAANIILANDIVLAAGKLSRAGLKFSGANIDGTWALNEDMLSRMHSLGAFDIWDNDAIISVNLPNAHAAPDLAAAKSDLAKDENFAKCLVDYFSISMPLSYVLACIPSIVAPLAAIHSFAKGAGKEHKPYGTGFGIYSGKDTTSAIKMGFVTIELSDSPKSNELNSYLDKFNSILTV